MTQDPPQSMHPWTDQIPSSGPGLDPRRVQARRLAAAVRRMLHAMVNTEASEADLREAADRVEPLAASFEANMKASLYEGYAEAANSGDVHGFFEHSPMLGPANPLAPPLTLEVVDEATVAGRGVFGAAYEGPPGCVHGGYVAAAFDEVLGMTQSLSNQPGMTARLSIDYRSPTPLHEELRFEGRFEGVEGRKVFTTGRLTAGDRLCAEAQGLFVSMTPGRFDELKDQRDRRRA